MIRFGGLKLFTPFKTFKRWNSPAERFEQLERFELFER